MAINLYEELGRLTSAFEDSGIDYALVGALSLALHGVPRATTDIDILVQPASVDKVIRLIKDQGFRFEALPIRFTDGMELRRVTKIEEEEPYETLTVDVLIVNPNLEEVWASRRRLVGDFGSLWTISRQALIQMKTWAGRERDLADLRCLEDLDR